MKYYKYDGTPISNKEFYAKGDGIIEFGKRGWKEYRKNHNKHRIDGPALIDKQTGKLYYYIEGEEVTKEEQELLYSLYKLKGLQV
jgi:hypothetical protein